MESTMNLTKTLSNLVKSQIEQVASLQVSILSSAEKISTQKEEAAAAQIPNLFEMGKNELSDKNLENPQLLKNYEETKEDKSVFTLFEAQEKERKESNCSNKGRGRDLFLEEMANSQEQTHLSELPHSETGLGIGNLHSQIETDLRTQAPGEIRVGNYSGLEMEEKKKREAGLYEMSSLLDHFARTQSVPANEEMLSQNLNLVLQSIQGRSNTEGLIEGEEKERRARVQAQAEAEVEAKALGELQRDPHSEAYSGMQNLLTGFPYSAPSQININNPYTTIPNTHNNMNTILNTMPQTIPQTIPHTIPQTIPPIPNMASAALNKNPFTYFPSLPPPPALHQLHTQNHQTHQTHQTQTQTQTHNQNQFFYFLLSKKDFPSLIKFVTFLSTFSLNLSVG